MIIQQILTDRHYQDWPSWQIIYEWENELSSFLKLPIKNSPPIPKKLVNKLFGKVDRNLFNGRIGSSLNNLHLKDQGHSLYFEMTPKDYKDFSNNSKTIPVIIDFFNISYIKRLKKQYKHCPYILVTSLEVFHLLRENGFRSNVIHFPMSLPTMYKLKTDQYFEKKYDIVLVGRINVALWNFLKQYEINHPEIEYLYSFVQNGELYYKNNRGAILGKFHSRSEYIRLIRLARVSFYATPGIDGGEIRSNGFNPVTPRFFELLAAGCHVLARYPQSVETEYYNMGSISPSISTYEEFESELNIALNSTPPIKRNSEYLSSHYMSNKIKILEELT